MLSVCKTLSWSSLEEWHSCTLLVEMSPFYSRAIWPYVSSEVYEKCIFDPMVLLLEIYLCKKYTLYVNAERTHTCIEEIRSRAEMSSRSILTHKF